MNKINEKAKFDFDDILIEPEYTTNIESRYKDIEINELPIITAPMDTVVDLKTMNSFLKNGISVALPRTVSNTEISLNKTLDSISENDFTFIGMGLLDVEYHLRSKFKIFPRGCKILIDVANGHMDKIIDYCNLIKKNRPDIIIMVGNIANPDTYRAYALNECCDYIRVGIGNGGGCLTTKQSGIGFPMASLIYETYLIKQKMINDHTEAYDLRHLEHHVITKYPKIVADGGMKDYSDIIKALALGADMVMVGSIFNKALESAGTSYFMGLSVEPKIANWLYDHNFTVRKHFRGMSTKGAQKAMGKTEFKTSEGVVRYNKVEYRLEGWVKNMEHYLRNAMSYSNCSTLEDFIGNVNIIQITEKAHDRFNK